MGITGRRRRPKKRTKKTRRRTGRRGRWGILHVFIIGVTLATAWVLWTDQVVKRQFQERRWALPSLVFARPLELYQGQRLDAGRLTKELDLLGYRNTEDVVRPGDYSHERDRVVVYVREFNFPDALEPAIRIKVDFDGVRLASLTALDGGVARSLVRVDPYLLGKIYPYHKEDRLLVDIDHINPLLTSAVLAIEDHRFYRHLGIDPRAILRALMANLRSGKMSQGGSTITQQLVKNFYLTRERTLSRKINEAVMALLLERRYAKDEILEAYLNEVFLGQDGQRAIHGFGSAAEYYFATPLNELRLHQLAMLAGLVKGASYYDPIRHPKRARGRRDLVLTRLGALGVVDAKTVQAHIAKPLDINVSSRSTSTRYPAYMDLVRRQLGRDYSDNDLRSEGLRIFTALDPLAQLAAEEALTTRLERLERKYPGRAQKLQGALMVADKEGGDVLAVVGDRAPGFAGFNRALDAKRQVGSLLKPAVFMEALARPGLYHLLSPISDAPLVWSGQSSKPWRPRNYGGRYRGIIPLHQGFAQSNNLVTVRIAKAIGLIDVIRRINALGIDSDLPNYPSLVLGAVDLSVFEITQMYQTLAAGGFRQPLRTVRAVVDAKGRLLQRYPLATKQVADADLAFLVKFLLVEVFRAGTAKSVVSRIPEGMPMAGKTGTTNDLRDSWFAGFNDELLAVVWLGRDDNQSIGLTGASGALQVWADFMRQRIPAPLKLSPPPGVVWLWIDPGSGLRTDARCAGAKRYPFSTRSARLEYHPCKRPG